MSKDKNRHQIIVRISIENSVPRVRPLTAREQEQFLKTHPNVQLPTFSPEEVMRGLEELVLTHATSPSLENRLIDPSMTSDPSAR
jgi:hypothetical protein